MSRFVLAFDTATEVIAVAVGERRGDAVTVLAVENVAAPRAAMSRLLPTVAEVLATAGVEIGDIREVVVGRGPGSFTGVRIGVATAKGVAHGLGAPLYGVGTLDAVSWGLTSHPGLLGVVGDAMRGEVYPALFRVEDGHPVRLGEDEVARPQDVAGDWAMLDESVLLAGNGLHKYAGVFREAMGTRAILAEEPLWAPAGRGLLAAYQATLARGEVAGGDSGLLLPIYTRLSDAEEAEQERLGSTKRSRETGVRGPRGERLG